MKYEDILHDNEIYS